MMAGNETTRYSYPGIPEIPQDDVEFGKEIGRGGTSYVFQGIWKTKDDFPVAIKHLHRNVQEIEFIALKMIKDDKENKHKIGKTFIAHILGLITKPPLTCIVLEYAENGSLLEYLSQKRKQQQPLEHDKFFTWTRQGALAMQYLHECKIIHRDIKSANFVITDKYNLKLCDFGISRITDQTITTTFAGSIPWMAPESHDEAFSLNTDIEVSPRSDIYSYGVVIWEMWTCRKPEVSMKVNGMYPIVEGTPPKLKDMLHSCWEVDRKKRPSIPDILQTMEDLSVTKGIEVKDFIEMPNDRKLPGNDDDAEYETLKYSDVAMQLRKFGDRLVDGEVEGIFGVWGIID